LDAFKWRRILRGTDAGLSGQSDPLPCLATTTNKDGPCRAVGLCAAAPSPTVATQLSPLNILFHMRIYACPTPPLRPGSEPEVTLSCTGPKSSHSYVCFNPNSLSTINGSIDYALSARSWISFTTLKLFHIRQPADRRNEAQNLSHVQCAKKGRQDGFRARCYIT
jgi:hypothetical protein